MDKIEIASEDFDTIFDTVLYNPVIEGFGIYPLSNNGVPRTEWQEGYNAAINSLLDRVIVVQEELRQLPIEQKLGFLKLISSGAVFIMFEKEDNKINKVLYRLNINDLFCTAADCEDFSLEEFPLIIEMYNKFGYVGYWSWVNMKRGFTEHPIRCSKKETSDFKSANEYLKSLI